MPVAVLSQRQVTHDQPVVKFTFGLSLRVYCQQAIAFALRFCLFRVVVRRDSYGNTCGPSLLPAACAPLGTPDSRCEKLMRYRHVHARRQYRSVVRQWCTAFAQQIPFRFSRSRFLCLAGAIENHAAAMQRGAETEHRSRDGCATT